MVNFWVPTRTKNFFNKYCMDTKKHDVHQEYVHSSHLNVINHMGKYNFHEGNSADELLIKKLFFLTLVSMKS